MKQRSKTVQAAIDRVYARLATAAAKKAVKAVEDWDNTVKADSLMVDVQNWLTKAGAAATRWHFEFPR